MSNASSTIQRDNPSLLSTTSRSPMTQGLRLHGANVASGFAQVLQAFGSPAATGSGDGSQEIDDLQRSDPAQAEENGTSSDEDVSGASGDSERSGEASVGDDEQQGADEGNAVQAEEAGSGSGTGQADADTQANIDAQTADAEPLANAQIPVQSQAGQINADTRLELLTNQADLAKLSMRGLVRSLRIQTSPDLTSVAVQTRLGEVQGDATSQNQAARPAIPSGDAAQPDGANQPQKQVSKPLNEHSVALSDRVAPSPRTGKETVPRTVPNTTTQPIEPAAVRNEQSRADVQHSRSVRAESGIANQSQGKLDLTRIASLHQASQGTRAPRVDGAMTGRAIAGVEGGAESATLKATQQQAQPLDAAGKDQGANRAAILAQVQRGLAQMMRSGKGDMTLKLSPEHLGQVRIQMKQDGDRISLRLSASTERGHEMLSSGSKELMHTLLAKGITVERVHVELQAQDATDSGHTASGSDQQTDGGQTHGDSPGGRSSRGVQDDVVPLTHDANEPDPQDPAAIWTELGLDAIA